jgi:hypothetical protein
MENIQFWSLVGMLAAGFGWMLVRFEKKFDKVEAKIDHLEGKLSGIENRLTVVETILSMMGMPIKEKK